MSKRIAILLKGYPRLSETFIAQEIHALEKAGFDIVIFSMRAPREKVVHTINKKIKSKIIYLPEYLHFSPIKVFWAWIKVRRYENYKKTYGLFKSHFKQDRTRNRIRRFGQALVLSSYLKNKFDHLYVHFLHTPASVGYYTSHLIDIPWSASAHAKDIWTSSKKDIQEKINHAHWVTTCTSFGHDYLKKLSEDPSKIFLTYHGLDFNRFSDYDRSKQVKDVVELLSVGRIVPKKGFDVLLKSLSQLKSQNWHWTHIGDGEEKEKLQSLAKSLKVDHKISWMGAQTHKVILSLYRIADIFILPSIVTKNGDRDGLPNVLMEAMSQRLLCVTSDLPNIKELLEDKKNALLVPCSDIKKLTKTIDYAICHKDELWNIRNQGYEDVRKKMDFDQHIQKLIAYF